MVAGLTLGIAGIYMLYTASAATAAAIAPPLALLVVGLYCLVYAAGQYQYKRKIESAFFAKSPSLLPQLTATDSPAALSV